MAEANMREAISEARAELSAKPEKSEREPKTERVETPERTEVADTQDDWKEPGWVNQWKKPSREKLRALAKLEGARDLMPDVLKEIEDRYDYSGKTQAEFDKYKKRFDPYEQVLSPLEQRFQLQGIHPQAGLQQMVAVNDLLQRDPDQAFMWLAQNFKPRDAQALIQNFAQHYGVDLGGVAAQQPWVDPAVANMVRPLEQQNRFLMEQFQQQNHRNYQQAATQVAEAISAFKSAQDESGNPKYPHYERLEPRMTAILKAEGIKPLEDLYEQAIWSDPELREQAIADRAKKANQTAVQEAERKSAEVESAMKASRNVNGSRTASRDKQHANLRDALKDTAKRLANK